LSSLKFRGISAASCQRWLIFLLCILLFASNADAARRRGRRVKKKAKAVIEKPVGLLADAQAVHDSLLVLAKGASPQEKVRIALKLGTFSENDSAFVELQRADSLAAEQARARYYLQSYRFPEARASIAKLAKMPANPESDWLMYRWLFVTEDLEKVDSLTRNAIAKDSMNFAALVARGDLFYRLLRFEDARKNYEAALWRTDNPLWHARTNLGLARVLFREDLYQTSFDTLKVLMKPATLDDEILYNMGLALVSLSRINDATNLFEEAIRWDPWYEMAHYYLGNGYARSDYNLLAKKNPACFVSDNDLAEYSRAEIAFRSGNIDSAEAIAKALAFNNAKLVEPLVLLGSMAWNKSQFNDAIGYFQDALLRLPAYGRAHNGFAKALEGIRMRENVHRAQDSTAFARQVMPDIPGIENYVLNWKSLSPRHKKQVALSVEPWKAYLPALIECGSHYYIKPLHEKLSESPGCETMRDQRIDYDSRLWDDVRGCGGYTTVTGIEDVERTIYSNYNTVLHEMTHQVHGMFPPEDADRIQEAFRAARMCEDSGKQTFMSRYQQSSVWEYFAEGANAYFSYRRDAFDTRDITRERLMARDTTLVKLVEYFVKAPNLTACYPVGLVNAASNAVEKQDLNGALNFARRASARSSHSESVLAELSRVYSYLDQDSLAMLYADSLILLYPKKAESYTLKSTAQFFTGRSHETVIETLAKGLAVADSTEKRAIRQALGNELWYAGKYAEAAEQYRAILREVRDDPDALWGLGVALGDAGEFWKADSAFCVALARRNGIVELRLDFARMLMDMGRMDAAAEQIKEAQTLAHGDAQVITMKAWYVMRSDSALTWKQWELLRGQLDRAIQLAPELRLASILKIEALKQKQPARRKPVSKLPTPAQQIDLMNAAMQSDIPSWVYLERKAGYIPGKIWPKYQRDLLKKISAQE
jgi:tetratricopeptide (TPR) repeat protein